MNRRSPLKIADFPGFFTTLQFVTSCVAYMYLQGDTRQVCNVAKCKVRASVHWEQRRELSCVCVKHSYQISIVALIRKSSGSDCWIGFSMCTLVRHCYPYLNFTLIWSKFMMGIPSFLFSEQGWGNSLMFNMIHKNVWKVHFTSVPVKMNFTSDFDPKDTFASAIAGGVEGAIGLLLNTFSIFVILKSDKLRKNVLSSLICALAFSDIIFCLSLMLVIPQFYKNEPYPEGSFQCIFTPIVYR